MYTYKWQYQIVSTCTGIQHRVLCLQAPNVSSFATELLMSAEKYHLAGLKTICEAELTSTLTVNNAVEHLILADMHNAPQLRKSAVQFIARNLYDIQHHGSWNLLENNNHSLSLDLLKDVGTILRALQPL